MNRPEFHLREKMLQICLWLFLLPVCVSAKTLIITHSYNRTDFIKIQDKALKKFIRDDFEYVVFNDARERDKQEEIAQVCHALNIRCIYVPQELHHADIDASYRHATAVKYSLETIGYDFAGIVAILDNDLVPIRSFSFEEYMKDKHIAGRMNRPRNKLFYISPLFCILNMPMLPEKRSLSFDLITFNGLGTDTGGASYYYLLAHPELHVTPVSMIFSHQLFLADKHIGKLPDNEVSNESKIGFYEHFGFNDAEIHFLLKKPDTFEFYLDNVFFHYRGSTYTAGDKEKMWLFTEFLNTILQNKPDTPFHHI